MQVLSRQEAINSGKRKYFTGVACGRGHIAQRYSSSRNCVSCINNHNWKARNTPLPTRPMPNNCEICGREPGERSLHLDHDHETKKFRGWLCQQCNRGIGLLGDNLESLMRVVLYLQPLDREN